MLKKRGQTWSFDLVIAVILFIVVIAVFYAFLSGKNTESSAQEQQDVAKVLSTKLVCDAAQTSSHCFIEDGIVDAEKIEDLADSNDNYEALKSDLGVQGDFCIYMVVVGDDGTERIVPFETGEDAFGNTKSLAGVGSSDFALTQNVACGESLN